jgi:N-acetylmuramoyl-L-alanine amidase
MIQRAKNTNIIHLSAVPLEINSVTVKSAGKNFFTNINNYTLTGKTITLKKVYTEIKVDFLTQQEKQDSQAVDKGDFNFKLLNIGKTNPLDLITASSKTAQSNRIAVQGSKAIDVNQLLGGFLTLSKNTKQNQTVTDEPVVSIITDGVPNVTVKKTSDEKGNISILTNTTTEDGLLNTTIVTANPAGIKAALTDVIGVSENQTKLVLQQTSTSPDKVTTVINKDISTEVIKDAQTIIKKSNRTLGNPVGSDLPFGSLGNSFGNILGAVLGAIKGIPAAKKFGDVMPGTPPGLIIPENVIPPQNIIEKSGNTNIAATTKPTNNASPNIKPTNKPYIVSSAVSGWKGVTTPLSTGEYVFEIVHTTEELEAELRNSIRDITTAIVHWSKTHSDTPLNARDVHKLHMAEQWEALGADEDALKILVDQGAKNGINWHYVIKKDGTIQRGRPLDIESGETVGFTANTIHIGFVAGYSVPFGTPNSELTLGSASITSEQWKSFDQFLEAFYKAYPGGEVLGYREIDKTTSAPGFDVSAYAASKYDKTSIYDDASTLHQAYSPEEQINVKPKTVKKPSATTIDIPPDPAELSVADVDTKPTDAKLEQNSKSYSKLDRDLKSLQRDIVNNKSSIEELENSPGADRLKLITRVKNDTIRLDAKRNELNQIRKDLINDGYTYDHKNDTWSKT